MILNNLGEEVFVPINYFLRQKNRLSSPKKINANNIHEIKNGDVVTFAGTGSTKQHSKAYSRRNALNEMGKYKIIKKIQIPQPAQNDQSAQNKKGLSFSIA